MLQVKRGQSTSESSEDETKKLKTTYDDKKITNCFENLSNELFYEIFDYFEGYKLYKAFSNLNSRFQALLTCSSLRLKIDLCFHPEAILQYFANSIVVPNKDRIISLSLANSLLYRFYAEFDELEMFLMKVSPQLEVLRVNSCSDVTYLDANRWERIISKHLLHLNKFEFKYEESIDEELVATVYHERLNEFKSLFWIKRQWFFKISIDTDSWDSNVIVYSIHSYRFIEKNHIC
ncbi:unnamed protein product [Rotaria sordida]|uniref:F-box domain-containing protein n=1 Tax=Rotaria sordida TaxID=392033 RepID=A0A814ZPE1_9BILA|nr:unnamed protein product [Rotaria sordida]